MAPDGTVIWNIKGDLRADSARASQGIELLEAAAECALPDRRVTARAGRARYAVGAPQIVFDHRLFVTSPSYGASLETDRAEFVLENRQFQVTQLSRAVVGDRVIESPHLTAEIDLRTLEATDLTVTRHGDTGPLWSAQAKSGQVDPERRIHLETVTGQFHEGGQAYDFHAPRAVWKPAGALLNFEAGASVTSRGVTLTADAATWQHTTQRLVTRGTTRAVGERLDLSGSGGEVDLVSGEATLHGLHGTVKQIALRARRGRLSRDGVLRLSDVTATLPNGSRLRAAEAVYAADRQRLELTGGGQVVRGSATASANRVVWDRAADSLVATGHVRLEVPGTSVTGDRLTGPAELSRATLTPVVAVGRNRRGQWTLRAANGTWTPDQLTVTEPQAQFRRDGSRATATAGQAVYRPATETVTMTGGFHAESQTDQVDVTADKAVYEAASGVFRAQGNVRATVGGLRVADQDWRYFLGGDRAGRVGSSGTGLGPDGANAATQEESRDAAANSKLDEQQ